MPGTALNAYPSTKNLPAYVDLDYGTFYVYQGQLRLKVNNSYDVAVKDGVSVVKPRNQAGITVVSSIDYHY